PVTGPDEAGLDAVFVANTMRVMFQGGYSTMVASIGSLTQTLLHHPGVLEEIQANPGLTPTAVEEIVRFDGPVQGTSRVAVTGTTLRGQTIAAGQTVLTLYAAANHDPEAFDRPGELLLSRSPNPHLGFGWGPHSCLGTISAQTVLSALLTTLAGHPAALRAAGPAQRDTTATMRRLAVLPVTFQP
ncbi:MAG: cytochrome P450, partial [Streptosporangiaceae bacterium]